MEMDDDRPNGKDVGRLPSIDDVRESALELDKISARRSKSQSARSSGELPPTRRSLEDRGFISALKRQLGSLEARNKLSAADGRLPQVCYYIMYSAPLANAYS